MSDVADFYDRLAPDYDLMTGFEQRFVRERPFFRLLVERYGIQRALDAGCGTGFHSFLLAQLGVEVSAVDVSAAMLEQLSAHSRELQLPVRTLQASLGSLAGRFDSTFDAVFCLGNTLAHLVTDDELRAALADFAAVLDPDGVLILQLLNFERILKSAERIQSVKEQGNKTFVRFYDFESNIVRFNVLTLERGKGSVHYSLRSVHLRPICRAELTDALRASGFEEPNVYGAISLEEFTADSSPDLVAIARKAPESTSLR